jgi:hypothetical protein
VSPGESLQIAGDELATQDPKQRHEEQEPLGITHPTPVASIRDGLEKANQIIRNTLIDYGGVGFRQPLRARQRLRER